MPRAKASLVPTSWKAAWNEVREPRADKRRAYTKARSQILHAPYHLLVVGQECGASKELLGTNKKSLLNEVAVVTHKEINPFAYTH